jgi:hypothetical protein
VSLEHAFNQAKYRRLTSPTSLDDLLARYPGRRGTANLTRVLGPRGGCPSTSSAWGLIVYLSDFGPLKNPLFALWCDMVVVAIFSLGIFVWAARVALPTAAIERLVATVPEEEAPIDSADADDAYDRRYDVPASSR